MKLYMITSGAFGDGGEPEEKIFKTKKDCHAYMRDMNNATFHKHKPYDYYHNTKIQVWYRIDEVEFIEDYEKYKESKHE